MTNPLDDGKPAGIRRTAQEWCDIGNDRLAARTPYVGRKFQGYAARPDVYWFLENGRPQIGFRS